MIFKYPDVAAGNGGQVMTIDVEFDRNPFVLFGVGSIFKFSYTTSFDIFCSTQEQIDRCRELLSDEGEIECGWMKDKLGLSWQIVPEAFGRLVADTDRINRKPF